MPTPRADARRDDPRSEFQAIVIGSGFGGAVAAARLSQAGVDTAIIERGRRWAPGTFPRDTSRVNRDWLWEKDRGLYDIRWLDTMISVQGAGWGGGSLVYANVFARPPSDVFASAWPPALTREALDPYFDLVAHMLEVHPVTTDPATGRLPGRTEAMERVARNLSRSTGTVRPQLAVRFTDDTDPVVNRYGRPQRGCTFIGECVLGCNVGAKNSLDHNYLAVAEDNGATVFTDHTVQVIRDAGGMYEVQATDSITGTRRTFRGDIVVVAAGAVGSTELLLRSRSTGLPRLSPTLGQGFSGNGDYLSFVKGRGVPSDVGRGPTITTTTIVDFDLRGRQVWFQAQDGGYPSVLAQLVATMDPTRAQRAKLRALLAKAMARLKLDLAPPKPLMTMLLMGRDTSDGRMTIDHNGEAQVDWSNRANRALYRSEGQVARILARAMDATAKASPTWRYLRQAVTVHNLGGVKMGRSDRDGVVDDSGQVFNYPNLYVMDGSTLPTATGVNPSGTIAAVAERNVEQLIRRLTENPRWEAPEHVNVQPTVVPEDDAMRQLDLDRQRKSGDGVRFKERLTGIVPPGGSPAIVRMALRCELPGWRRFLADPERTLEVSGSARLPGIPASLLVHGSLSLFPTAADTAMLYSLRLSDATQAQWHLTATKVQRPGNPFTIWHDLTTMALTVKGPDGSITSGDARIRFPDVLRLVLTLRGLAFTRARRAKSTVKFVAYFARSVALRLLGRR